MASTRLRLRALRKARGWSQLELAQQANVRQATISEMETGKARRVSLDILDRLSRALKITPGELLERAPNGRAKHG